MNAGDSVFYRSKRGNLIPVRVLVSRITSTGKRSLCVLWPNGNQSWVLAEWCERGDGGVAPHAKPDSGRLRRPVHPRELHPRSHSFHAKQGGDDG
jgi:hypothetical protein